MTALIHILEDDSTIRGFIAKKLTSLGYQTNGFESVEEALLSQESPDLWVVDVLLVGEKKGTDFVRVLRTRDARVPVLILSALSEPEDRVQGLEAGADDYLSKPFEMKELVLRVEGMLKRRSWYRELPPTGNLYKWEGREIDFLKFEARNHGEIVTLGQKEAMVMKLLIEKEGQVVSRDEILNQVWGYDCYPTTRTVDNFIVRLRKVFEEEPSAPRFIHSIRGMGYKFTSKELS